MEPTSFRRRAHPNAVGSTAIPPPTTAGSDQGAGYDFAEEFRFGLDLIIAALEQARDAS